MLATASTDWCACVPEYGVGLLLIQFQASPPSLAGSAPAGTASSTHTTSVLLLITCDSVALLEAAFPASPE